MSARGLSSIFNESACMNGLVSGFLDNLKKKNQLDDSSDSLVTAISYKLLALIFIEVPNVMRVKV